MKSLTLRCFALLLICHPMFAQWISEPAPASGTLWNVQFLDENTGWLTGDDIYTSSDSAYVWMTNDGGMNWTRKDAWLGDAYEALAVLDGMTVLHSRTLAPDNAELRRTIDGGATWVTVDSVYGWYEDIEFVDTETGFVVGGVPPGEGFLRKTTDGGAHWEEIWTLESSDLTGVSFLSPTEGWVSAYWNELHRTTDAGVTWTKDSTYLPPMTPTRDVQFTTPDSGWAVGGIGGSLTISRTTDGGRTWSYYSPACGSSLRAIHMVSSQKGWVVGSLNCPPYIAYTSDGGVTWETQVSVDGFLSVSMVNEEEGWACGDFGVLYHTTTGGVTWVREVTETPVQYVVLQNYPDPFNPSTTFSFSTPHASIVKLAVFNLLGREVAVLVDRKLEPRSHTARWDAAPLPSGVYFARLSVGGIVVTKKLVRVR